ncbi:MAG: ATP-binding cassette domain-containing protein [Chromatiaceae bacterium]|nr:MAG: ATP-binding cassette domain-containing protein [Chromatiaceae bacterium]
MFELHQVSKHYGASVALERVTLRLEPGRTTALIGPSGCGKSTLLRMLIGLIRPDAGSDPGSDLRPDPTAAPDAPVPGEIRFDGTPLTPARIPALRRRMGYVIQSGGLFPHLDARANICLMARHLGWDAERIAARIEALAALTHFPRDGLARYPAELSGGQNQRVSLMRALMLDPEVLLLDEPLGALDPMVRYDLQEELKQVFATLGKTVVLVTHDLAEAAFLADCIVLMRAGRVVQSGRLEAMMRAPAEPFVEQFIRAQRSHLSDLEVPA